MSQKATQWRLLGLFVAFFALPSAVVGDLLIKQVVAGTDYNRCVQVMNVAEKSDTTPASSLSSYGLLWAPNGATQWTPLLTPLSNSGRVLAQGQAFMVCHPSAAALLEQASDALSATLLFSGDDVLSLAHREGDVWRPFDVFGDLRSFRPQGWAVAGVLGATKQHTLVRKPEVRISSMDWSQSAGTSGDTSQWIVYEENTVSLEGVVVKVNPKGGAVEDTAVGCPGKYSNPKPEDRRLNATNISIGTFTVPWLFDGVNDPPSSPWGGNGGDCPGFNSSTQPVPSCTANGAAARLLQVVDVIRKLDVDVMNIVEVEDCSVLGFLANASDPTRYRSFLRAGSDALGRNVGLITRVDPLAALQRSVLEVAYPIANSTCGFNGSGSTDVSRHYVTRFQWGAFPVTFIGVELTEDSADSAACAQREAEAQVLQLIINEALEAGQEVVLLGDLNDYSPLLDAGGNVPKSQVLRMLQDPDGDGVEELGSVSSVVPVRDRYTALGINNVKKQLDYILLSPRLMASVKTVFLATNAHPEDAVSSHWPVVVHLSIPPPPVISSLPPTLSPLPTAPAAAAVNNPRPNLEQSTNTSAAASSTKSSSNTTIVIIAAAVPSIAFILLLICLISTRLWKLARRRRTERRAVVAAEEGVTVGTWEPLELPPLPDMSSRPPSAWRPLDRSLPTIKSGEQLDMKLYVNPLILDDSF